MRIALSLFAGLMAVVAVSCSSVPPASPRAPNTEVIDLTNQVVALEQQIAQLRDSLAAAQAELDTLPGLRGKIVDFDALLERERVFVTQASGFTERLTATLALAKDLTLQRDRALARFSGVSADLDHSVQRIAALELRNAELEKRTVDLSELAGSEAKALDSRIASLNTLFAKEIAAGDLQIKRFRNVLVIEVKDTVLFAPDRPELLPANLGLLLRLAEVFRKSPERIVRVEGSTAVALSSPETLRLYPTSWHLGAARAANVVQYLQEVGHMDPSQLVAASLGEYSPVADNATEGGKAQNRRVEFIMTPRELWQTERLASVGR